MRLVQIERRHGTVDRVKYGVAPTIDRSLEDNQRIIAFSLHEGLPRGTRKTTDWRWTAYVETAQEVHSK